MAKDLSELYRQSSEKSKIDGCIVLDFEYYIDTMSFFS